LLNLYEFHRDDAVEPLSPHSDALPGDLVKVDNYESGKPDEVLNPKKKIWEKLQPELRVSATGEAQWSGNDLTTSKGTVLARKLQNCVIR